MKNRSLQILALMMFLVGPSAFAITTPGGSATQPTTGSYNYTDTPTRLNSQSWTQSRFYVARAATNWGTQSGCVTGSTGLRATGGSCGGQTSHDTTQAAPPSSGGALK